MTNKVQKIREEVERLKSNLIHGACSSQIAMETRCKEEAYNEVLAILDSLQEEPIYTDFTKALAECIHQAQCNVVDPMVLAETWKDELIKLAKSEEPVSEDLEVEIKRYLHEVYDRDNTVGDVARHFANWQKQQMMKKAFPVEIGRQRSDYKCVLHGNFSNCDTGDKVKVIVIKED